MKLTKKTEKEIKEVMNDYWNSYFEGNLDHWANYLVDDYRNIGGTEEEIWNSKKEILDYTYRVIDQMQGATELRNKQTQIIPYDPYVMVHELIDIYIKIEDEWTFYQKFRLSSLIQQTSDGWKVLHQHGSYPDSKTQEGEAFAFDTLKNENQKLQKAIKERTIELEEKNRELEIETALERVRSRTLLMKDSNELHEAVAVLFQQLQSLKLLPAEARTYFCHINAQTAMAKVWMTHADGTVMNASHQTPLMQSPSMLNYFEAWKRKEPVMVRNYSGAGLTEYLHFLNTLPHVNTDNDYQQLLSAPPEKIVMTDANFLQGNIGVMTFEPLSQEALGILVQFAKVFEFTYTRFLDLQKAEEQAREAQIETGLERVRSRSLAMHTTAELQEVIHTVHKELLRLNIAIHGGSFIVINSDIETELRCWGSGGTADTTEQVHIPIYEKPFCTNLTNRIKKGPGFFTEEYTQQEKKDFFTFLFKHEPWSKLDAKQKKETLSSPGGYTRSCCVSQHTSIFIINHFGDKFSTDDNDILQRFGKVFEQTYTRFLDLQKAEAQARQAKIEAALEKVRSRSMAMRDSKELHEVIKTVYSELKKLDVVFNRCFINIFDTDGGITWWMASPEDELFEDGFYVHNNEQPPHRAYLTAWKEKKDRWEYLLKGQTKKDWDDFLFGQTEFSKLHPVAIANMRGFESAWVAASFNNFGCLTVAGLDRLNAETFNILSRFSRVFDLAYTRFNDLKQAEAQAREAKIEAALERVRARAMAMQKSEELAEAAQLLYQELSKLDIKTFSCGYMFVDEEKNSQTAWVVLPDGTLLPNYIVFPLTGDKVLNSRYQDWKAKKPLHILEIQGEVNKEHHRFLSAHVPAFVVKEIFSQMPERIIFHCANFSQGYLLILAEAFFTVEEQQTVIRFANVFEITFTRFLDLQKAEAQAREAQIELGLERVRARAMAMQKSDELKDLIATVSFELGNLDFVLDRCFLMIFDHKTNDSTWWMSHPESPEPSGMYIKYHEHTPYLSYIKAWKERQKKWEYVLEGDVKRTWDEFLFNETELSKLPEQVAANMRGQEKVYFSSSFNNFGCLSLATLEPLSNDLFEVMLRFAKVFDLTYTRFNDLKQAEAQAREAKIEVALERVRARAMAMQTSEELESLIGIVFSELTKLDIVMIGCVIIIFDPESKSSSWWMVNSEAPDEPLSFFIKYHEHTPYKKFINAWEEKLLRWEYELKGSEKKQWDAFLFSETELAHVPIAVINGMRTPERILLSTSFNNFGCLNIGTVKSLTEEQFDILLRFASVFDLTYTRFNDLKQAEAQTLQAKKHLVQLEAEKNRAESALRELQATQQQLIQSEKMASLGELTAGIAHEIQNPLNFVNNFSEVNKELLVEMKEEIEKGNINEAKLLADDLIDNQEKINHHGKRADSIVKGMLQHSRSSSGKKEPTDINVLVDEYLRLCYHGLRAKDKAFNATMKTDFDATIEKINIVPQDVGRVILNLLTNAFYAAPPAPSRKNRDKLRGVQRPKL